MTWFYLSFVKCGAFAGACIVRAGDVASAVEVATVSGLNPGGQVVILNCPNNHPGPLPTYKLLSLEDLGAGVTTLGELMSRRLADPSYRSFPEGCVPVLQRAVKRSAA